MAASSDLACSFWLPSQALQVAALCALLAFKSAAMRQVIIEA